MTWTTRQIILWGSGFLVLASGILMVGYLACGESEKAVSPAINIISNLIIWVTWKYFL
jgi:hypothetical protein